MTGREDRIYEEAAALWREVFGEPPPIRANGETLLDVLLKALPDRSYERMASPYLRPSQITGPQAERRA
jgi:hypothetical protein